MSYVWTAPRKKPSDAFFPVRVTSLLEANGERAVGIRSLAAGPADGAANAFDFELGAQDDLLAIHAFGQNDGGFAEASGVGLTGAEVASLFEVAVEALRVDAQDSGDACDYVIDDREDKLHGVVELSLPDQRWAHAVAEALLHGAE